MTGLLASLIATFAAESSADACSPPLPGLVATLPESGATYPGNAVLFFQGYNISLDGMSVSVDGAPATLVSAPDFALAGFNLAARIEPPPGEGQAIVIEGDFCPVAAPCEVTRIELTAGAADTVAPPAPAGLSFDLYDYADFRSSGGDCQLDSDLGWWLTAGGEGTGAGESPVIYTIEAFRDDTFADLVFSESAFLRSSSLKVAIHRTANVLGGADAPEALCFRVKAIDAAGNAAAGTVQACAPCNYREDPGTAQPGVSPPLEPAWTAADRYPGGACDPGGGTASGGAGGENAGGSDAGGSDAGGSDVGGGDAGGGDAGSGGGGGSINGGAPEGGCRLQAAGAGGEGAPAIAALALLACAAFAGRRRR